MTDLLRAYEAHLLAANYSATTIRDRLELLRRIDADPAMPYGLCQASTDELIDWLGQDGWKPWTRYNYHGHLAAFFRWAVGRHHLDWDPVADITPPRMPARMPNPVTDDQLHDALTRSDDRWRLIITLAAYAGLRAGDISTLIRERVTERRIHIVAGKGGKDALLPTAAQVWELVEPYGPGLLVRTRTGRPFVGDCLSVMARQHFDALGMPDVHLHRFRHWHATALLAAGVDLATVSQLMRHSSPATTMGYLLISDSRRAGAVAALPRLGVAEPGSNRLGHAAA